MGQAALEYSVVRRIDGEYGIWQASGSRLILEYQLSALEEIRRLASEGYRAVPRGGLEVGGVLFGRCQGNLVQITSVAELKSEHAFGPGFTLSERDEAALRDLIESAAREPKPGAAAVGWFHSHTRSEIQLTERDLEVHNRFFPEPWQVALVVRPQQGAPMRAAFFVREANGTLPGEAPHEFEVRPYAAPQRPRPAFQAARAVTAPAAPPAAPEAPSESPLPADVHPIAAAPARPHARRNWSWAWLALAAAVFLAGLWLGTRGFVPGGGSPPASLGLRVVDVDGQLMITWDRGAPAVAAAQRAVIEVNDGGAKMTMQLDGDAVRNGNVTYARQAAQVDLRFAVYPPRGEPAVELVSFLGRPPAKPAAAPNEDRAARERDDAVRERDQALEEVSRLRSSLQSQLTRNAQLEEANRVLRRRVQVEESLRRRRR